MDRVKRHRREQSETVIPETFIHVGRLEVTFEMPCFSLLPFFSKLDLKVEDEWGVHVVNML